jgi:multidrug efflux pump subunit AcrB
VTAAVARAGKPPEGAKVEIRGQIPPMNEMSRGLSVGLVISIITVFLLLTANFQSIRLALVAVSSVPAVVAGVLLMLWITGTTLNIQSFIGAIMSIGVAMANAILLVTFAETRRREGENALDAAVHGAGGRLRAILLTSSAMIAGMLPMALAFGEAGQQNAPLGRAVIGGLAAATLATLFILPSVFALLQKRVTQKTPSLDPNDPDSAHYSPTTAAVQGA